jgi:hypothetical protein
MSDTTVYFNCKHCDKKFKSKGGVINHEKKCDKGKPSTTSGPTLENTLESTSSSPSQENREPSSDQNSEQKTYAENELIILKASDFDRMITDYLKIFMEHYNSQMTKLIDENRELVTYSNTLAEILKSIVCAKKASGSNSSS